MSLKTAIIKKKGDEWCVYTKDGKKELGCHPTEQKAQDQLAAIEIQKDAEAVPCCRHLVMKVGGDGAQIRTATYEGREHLVVPVIAIMEGVIHAVNAETPELVLAEELEQCFLGFNGRPVMADHPQEDGHKISANDPSVLERESFGTTFNAKIEDKKLKLEAWLDPRKASKNEKAEKIIARIRNNEMVEVSVGVFVATENRTGVVDGKEFSGIWRSIVPDHLAMLSEGTEGACSIEMGCGAPRAAQRKEEVVSMPEKEKTPCEKAAESTWERIQCLSQFKGAQGEEAFSDIDLREALDSALRKVEPGFLGVDAVFPNESLVVFTVAPDENWKFMRRSFDVDEDGEVKLKGESEEVRPVTRFESVKAAEAKQEVKETMDEKLKERLIALTKMERCPWGEDDLELLAGFPEEKIAALEAAFQPPPKPEPAPEPEVLPDPAKDLEEELGVSVAEAKTIIKAAQKAAADKKEALITQLKAAQEVYSEEELKAMDTAGLEKLARLARMEVIPDPPKVDFSLKTPPRAAEDGDEVPEPPNLFEKVREARAAH